MAEPTPQRLWISPHGTEWVAETYEEALEAERDALVAEVERLQEALGSVKGFVQLQNDDEISDGVRLGVVGIVDEALRGSVGDSESKGDANGRILVQAEGA